MELNFRFETKSVQLHFVANLTFDELSRQNLSESIPKIHSIIQCDFSCILSLYNLLHNSSLIF